MEAGLEIRQADNGDMRSEMLSGCYTPARSSAVVNPAAWRRRFLGDCVDTLEVDGSPMLGAPVDLAVRWVLAGEIV